MIDRLNWVETAKDEPCVCAKYHATPSDGSSNSVDSMVRPGTAPTSSCLRIRPYVPKLSASVRLIHKVVSAPAASNDTPMAARPTATHCARVSFSPSSNVPSSTLTSGLM